VADNPSAAGASGATAASASATAVAVVAAAGAGTSAFAASTGGAGVGSTAAGAAVVSTVSVGSAVAKHGLISGHSHHFRVSTTYSVLEHQLQQALQRQELGSRSWALQLQLGRLWPQEQQLVLARLPSVSQR